MVSESPAPVGLAEVCGGRQGSSHNSCWTMGVLTVAMVTRQLHLRWLKDVPGLGTVVLGTCSVPTPMSCSRPHVHACPSSVQSVWCPLLPSNLCVRRIVGI